MGVSEAFTFKLAKLMVAVSWCDGQIDQAEINALKKLLFKLPELNGREWAELEIYMDSPVDPEETRYLLEDVLAAMHTAEEKNNMLETMETFMASDGHVSDEENNLFNEFKEAVESKHTGIFGLFSRLSNGILKRQKEKTEENARREQSLEDFIRRKVVYDVKRTHPELSRISDRQLKKLCSAAALMGRVAAVDGDFSKQECEALVSVLMSGWQLAEPDAVLLTEIVRRRAMENIDYHYLTHDFFERTTHAERKQFLKCLFQIANAHGKTSHEEIEEIRIIAENLKMNHADFIDAKLSIPKADRSG